MRDSLAKSVLAATFAVGIAIAQTPAGGPRWSTGSAQSEEGACMRGHWNLDHLTQALNLTDSQKEQAQTIFQNARQSAQPIRQELKQNREKLSAAAKVSNNESDIQRLATEQGRLMGKLVAIHAQTSAKFYQMLTPEQRVKIDQMHEQFKQKARPESPRTYPR